MGSTVKHQEPLVLGLGRFLSILRFTTTTTTQKKTTMSTGVSCLALVASRTLYPTMAPIGGFSAGGATDGFTNPFPVSLALLNNNTDANDEPTGDSDSAHYVRGCTGNATFNLTTGEIAQIAFSFKGLVEDDKLIDTSVSNVMANGSFAQIGNAPFVVKDATLVFTDNASSSAVAVTALNDVTIEMNANVPDVTSANVDGNQGFDVSPVFWDESPTVSFTIAETNASDDVIFQRLFSGDTFDIQLTLTTPDAAGVSIKFDINTLQQTDVTVGETNGYATYSITGKCVRCKSHTYISKTRTSYYWS
jgi:hypothetical protein